MYRSKTTRRPLLHYAVDLLARKKYTVKEMRAKLLAYLQKYSTPEEENSKGITENPAGYSEVDKVINRLLELKYLNDLEYTGLFIDEQLRRSPQGIMMLRKRLSAKGLDKSFFEKVLQSRRIDEFELAEKALRKKIRTLIKTDPKKLQPKLYRFLLSRGFSPSSAMKAIENTTGQESFF